MAGGSGSAGGGDVPRGDLFAEMRRIKDASQLSYNRLADKTHYSRSSWERFLNGKQVPTRIAVEEFAAASGADPEPLLVLLELAAVREEAPAEEPAVRTPQDPEPAPGPSDSPTAAPAAAGAPVPEQDPAAGRFAWSRILRTAAGVLAGAVLGSVLTAFLIQPAGGGTAKGGTAGATGSPAATPAQTRPTGPVRVGCKSDTCLRREPQAEDCQWDAVTVRQTFLRGMSIQLRYSEACQAVWGRIENGNVGDTVMIKDRRSSSDEATIRMEHDTYTRMLAVTPEETWQTITICGAIPSQKEQECSPLGAITP
ncbi:helix-turn-helix domain-containing protein [Streptomyces sp. NPDC056387]|uniref:helix-turn-helix domain-containing protein n=1 Tax=Streptomyces sp. NPDC056387 TaxID=3345803 RepID=UPI0035DF1E37